VSRRKTFAMVQLGMDRPSPVVTPGDIARELVGCFGLTLASLTIFATVTLAVAAVSGA
jgi:hypothetical protein